MKNAIHKIRTVLLKQKAQPAKTLSIITVIIFLAISLLGYLNPIINFLDSDTLAFRIGETRFSAYLLIKAMLTITLFFWMATVFSNLSEKK